MGAPLNAESWIWFAVVISIASARFASRILLFRGDAKKLQIDDLLMFGALCTYTTFLVCINIISHNESNLLPPGFDMDLLTPAEIRHRQYGSKLVLVVEQCQCVTVWAVKACLSIMYYRLTIALKENIVVKVLSVYVAFGFIFMELFYFGVWCRPFRNYWAVPTPNVQCNAATNHLITNAVFNISSDLFLLILALQMIVRSSLPIMRKLILCFIFGLGIFVILAAILNKYYSFTNPFGRAWTFWYVRESSTSLLVANLPYTWNLLRRIFHLRAFNGRSSSGTGTRTNRARHAPSIGTATTLVAPSRCGTTSNGKGSFLRSDIGSFGTESPRNSSLQGNKELGYADGTLDSSRSSTTRSDKSPFKSWRDQEVYGRQDQEALAMGVEPYDFGASADDGTLNEGQRRSTDAEAAL
ncbi:uncharacterized protein K452DRAFT_351434 [Aplosporella prunicola CBS 121167]|uniref:Rhodopsin domain-containing protein n=1 Tax=Aplosporella prunicola CBS 121167 TaxID=1176127 RepID=A0A6A6BDC7_9PEZI|nr:uncharacterized protein K452DRAFT_351434 [Aplosporella prunicola CBS 121167]KAF2141295.1 hypothetical protein K452DRAFT_351434 [Aplosporella prunicola CBS 121167]